MEKHAAIPPPECIFGRRFHTKVSTGASLNCKKDAGSRKQGTQRSVSGGVLTRHLEVEVDVNSSHCPFEPEMETIHVRQMLFWPCHYQGDL